MQHRQPVPARHVVAQGRQRQRRLLLREREQHPQRGQQHRQLIRRLDHAVAAGRVRGQIARVRVEVLLSISQGARGDMYLPAVEQRPDTHKHKDRLLQQEHLRDGVQPAAERR